MKELKEIIEKEFESILREIEELGEPRIESIFEKYSSEYKKLIKEKERIETELAELAYIKENSIGVVIYRDRKDPSKKIGIVYHPDEYRGMIVLFSDQRLVANIPTKTGVYITKYEIRASRKGKKYIKAFDAYGLNNIVNREKELYDKLTKIEKNIKEIEKHIIAKRIAEKYGIDVAELATELNSIEEKGYNLYSEPMFRRLLVELPNMSKEEINTIKSQLFNMTNYIPSFYRDYVTIEGFPYSAYYIVMPVQGIYIDFDMDKDKEMNELKKEINKLGIDDIVYAIGELFNFTAYVPSYGAVTVTALLIKPGIELPPERIMEINEKLLAMIIITEKFDGMMFPKIDTKKVAEELWKIFSTYINNITA